MLCIFNLRCGFAIKPGYVVEYMVVALFPFGWNPLPEQLFAVRVQENAFDFCAAEIYADSKHDGVRLFV